MQLETRFSSELLQIEDIPEPIQGALRKNLHPGTAVSLFVFKPIETASGVTSSAKLLAVTGDGLILIEEKSDQSTVVKRCGFDAVLLIELATLLLYGHLKIHFVDKNASDSFAMEHNLVAFDVYRRASALILSRTAGATAATEAGSGKRDLDARADISSLGAWPRPIRDACQASLLSPSAPHVSTWWPGIRGGFGFELAPMGAVLAVDDRIVVVMVEQTGPWNRVREAPTYGTVATYIPSNRVAAVHCDERKHFSVIDLEMHACHGGERFSFMVPNDCKSPVLAVIDSAFSLSRT